MKKPTSTTFIYLAIGIIFFIGTVILASPMQKHVINRAFAGRTEALSVSVR
jgi:hypothetical protein